jgi:hypothetical protein
MTDWITINATAKAENDAKALNKARKVADLIKPPGHKAQACREDAVKFIWMIDEHECFYNGTYVERTAATKDKLRGLAKAIVKVEYALKEIVFPFEVDPSIPTSINAVLAFGKRCEEVANAKGKPPKKEAAMKPHAVRYAHWLMKRYGADIKGTKGSTFSKLASLLHGGLGTPSKKVDLTEQCEDYLRALKKRVDVNSK